MRLKWLWITLGVIFGAAILSGIVFPIQHFSYHPFRQMVAPFYVLSEAFPRLFDPRTSLTTYLLLFFPIISTIAISAAIVFTRRLLLIVSVTFLVIWWGALTFLYTVSTSSSY